MHAKCAAAAMLNHMMEKGIHLTSKQLRRGMMMQKDEIVFRLDRWKYKIQGRFKADLIFQQGPTKWDH